MEIRNIFSVTNIIFLIGGCYFVIVAALGEATIYSVFLSVLCFLSFLFSFREGLYFAGPWRVATSTAVLILLAGQEVVSFGALSSADTFSALIIILNGILFVVFFGVLLSTSREVTKQKSSEQEIESEEELENSS
jgi:hypothetical protein